MFVGACRAYCSKEFAVFLVFGGTAAAVNLAAGIALYDYGLGRAFSYEVNVWLAATCGLIVNFVLNYFFNFKFRGRSVWQQLRTFCVVAIIGTFLTAFLAKVFLFGINLTLLPQLFEPFSVSAQFLAHTLSVAVVTFYSYAAHRAFSFNVGIRQRLFGKN